MPCPVLSPLFVRMSVVINLQGLSAFGFSCKGEA